ncbi:M14-type cytosolic carboxypeptidase [Porticoccus sp. W117]|uniref:M14-type cytosolic carboxypeptidase n=1 Tax=Porticoccus sp. W117 TaxID=3054777 RepID=UPI002592A458|nr:M14-type cytosolic carboxypeptidase [Porticoccus sp. W117]MDM3869979.1 M14-type cytosolic carboxypeptidase [Porticoccus sp. W117]
MKTIINSLVIFCCFAAQGCTAHSDAPGNQVQTAPAAGTVAIQQKKTYGFDQDGVYISNQFDGARLNNAVRLAANRYQLTIEPENIPVNSSSYFAFQVWSDKPKTVELNIKYTAHKHRYIPKISRDGKNWQPVDGVVASEGDTLITLNVQAEQQKTWLAAQEVTSSSDTY